MSKVTEEVEKSINWANERLKIRGEELTRTQLEAIKFSILANENIFTAKPLDFEAHEILDKTFSRLLKQEPTRLS